MQYIRDTYKVPAKRGARIEYSGDETEKFLKGFLYKPRKGTVVAAKGNYLRVRFDGKREIATLHPTWKVRYL